MRADVQFAASADKAAKAAISHTKQLDFANLTRMLNGMRMAAHKVEWMDDIEAGMLVGKTPTVRHPRHHHLTALVATVDTTTIAQFTPVLHSFAFFNHIPTKLLEKLPHTNGARTTSTPPQRHPHTSSCRWHAARFRPVYAAVGNGHLARHITSPCWADLDRGYQAGN